MNITEELKSQTLEISAEKKYWFIRTKGGEYYNDFFKGGFIAIAYNKIQLYDLNQAKKFSKPSKELGKILKKLYPDNKTPTNSANQILKFVDEIKAGDIVLIPSADSDIITFGEVLENLVYIKSDSDKDDCPHEKRKKVKWTKNVEKYKLNPNLYKLIYSHHALTDASPYDEYIDKTLNSFFIKNGRTHLVLNITTKDGINAKELFKLGLGFFKCVDEISKENNYNIDSEDIEVKTYLESPGTIEFISHSVLVLAIVGFIIVLLNGGSFEANFRITSFKLNSQGLIKAINQFLNERQDREIKNVMLEQLKKLQVQSPDEIIKLIGNEMDKIGKPKNDDDAES